MRPSRVPTTSLRLNKSSDHKAEQQRAKLGYINDKWQPCAALVEPWGMTNNDTLIKLDEANGQCVVACSSLSVSWKLWTCPAISRVKHIGQHPFLFWQKACCAQQEYQQGLISMGQATGHAGRYEEATKSYESSLQTLQACIIYITPYCSIPAHQAQFTTTNVLVALPFHE